MTENISLDFVYLPHIWFRVDNFEADVNSLSSRMLRGGDLLPAERHNIDVHRLPIVLDGVWQMVRNDSEFNPDHVNLLN